ncbi:hypothetical protein [Streptomyces sp. SAI-208]|uniref:hypothetical protein n=1 Tax=Streptomyces sp. SAI-208 TaxID=2940550 RepID=UPI00247439C9|nr:hypothetical protein [Streptomyces sp. SAI-208]
MKSRRTTAPWSTRTVCVTVIAGPEPSAGGAVTLKVYVPLGTYPPLPSRSSHRTDRFPDTSPPENVRTTVPVALLVSVAFQEAAGLESSPRHCHHGSPPMLLVTSDSITPRAWVAAPLGTRWIRRSAST